MDFSNVDERFQSVFHDKKFRSIRQKQRKINIDRRFHSMFTDDNFKLQYKIDKRGKPLLETSAENLKKYYRIPYKEKKQLKLERKKERNRLKNILNDKKDTEIDSNKDQKVEEENNDLKTAADESSDEYISSDEDSSEEDEIDLARGEGNIESSSEEENEEYDEDIEMLAEGGHNWEQLDDDAVRSDEVSSRLALCHMDWDRIKAVDLIVLFDGFKPTSGSIKKVTIYPSDFGAKRLAEENRFGPAELLQDNDCIDDKETARLQNEKFREHQLNRLKYYYAVIECDSKTTAEAIYKDCDGFEFESSSSKLDLRFIPDDMQFDDHPPKDSADFVPDKDQYKPTHFVTTALNLTKVNLTWDETDHRRVRLMTRKFKEDELAEMDMKDFVASSSEEEEEEEEEVEKNNGNTTKKIGISSKTTDQDQIARYRSLLLGEMDGDEEGKEDKDVDMEITWEPNLDEIEEGEDEPLVSDDEKEKDESDDENSTLNDSDVELKPRKQKKKKRKRVEDVEIDPKKKAELEMLMIDAEDSKLKHFDIHQIVKDEKMSKKKKRKLGKVDVEDNFELDMNDSRFSAVFTSPEFAVDPNNPAFRKTKAMKELVDERQNRLHHRDVFEEGAPADEVVTEVRPANNDSDINRLVNSIKTKTKKQFSKKKSKMQQKSSK